MQHRNKTLVWSAAGLLVVGAATGLSAQTLLQHQATPEAATSIAPVAPLPPGSAPNYRAIVANNQAAVVGITTQGTVKAANQPGFGGPGDSGPGDSDDPLAQFFFHGMPNQRRPRLMRAQGSGFIVSSDGLILTNAHVVAGAQEVTVKLSNHQEYKAKVLGSDKSSDIAVLKIDAHDLPTVQLGNSDQIAVGDYVLAIGEPFGLEETATAGIVSAKGRSLPGDGYVPFIQTDAAVNPGNSGGPLFDANGRVVGINAQIYSNSGGYEGVSFAIPINVAVQVKDQLVKTGKVNHARLGVEVQTMDQTLARSFNLTSPNGALVAQVVPDSAAANAGIKVGDVILKVNGAPIINAGQLSARVGMMTPGSTVTLDVWRQGKPLSVEAKIGSASAELADNGAADAGRGKLGLSVRPLSPDEKSQAGVSGGLLVQDAEGKAAEAGIQPGDVVLSVDGTPIESAAQLRKLVDAHSKEVALLILRGQSRIFVPIELG